MNTSCIVIFTLSIEYYRTVSPNKAVHQTSFTAFAGLEDVFGTELNIIQYHWLITKRLSLSYHHLNLVGRIDEMFFCVSGEQRGYFEDYFGQRERERERCEQKTEILTSVNCVNCVSSN